MKTFYVCLSLSICTVVLAFFIGCFYAYNYPMKYSSEIREYAAEYKIDGAMIASVVNVESGFREEARSSKGAVGLMQLMPTTAEWIAEKLGEEYEPDKLEEGRYNLKLGSFYLSYLVEYFDDLELGLCAYNAGLGNVSKWLGDTRYSKDGKTLNEIPFKETKNYLNKVSKNYNYYKNKYKN